jgi:hypothetical protein
MHEEAGHIVETPVEARADNAAWMEQNPEKRIHPVTQDR